MSPKVTWRRVPDVPGDIEDTTEVLEESSLLPPRPDMTITVREVSTQSIENNRHGEVLIYYVEMPPPA